MTTIVSMIRDWPGWAVAIGLGILVFIVLSVGEYIWKKYVFRYFTKKKQLTETDRALELDKKLSDLTKDYEDLKRHAESKDRALSGYDRKIADLEGKAYALQERVSVKNAELFGLQNEYEAFKRDVGRWRIKECGRSDSSLDLSVAIHFIDYQDVALAKRIRDFFWLGNPPLQGFPWTKTDDISHVPWFENRSASRIVIFSDHRNAEGIKAAFNECNLLDELVDRCEMNFAKKEQRDYDIAIVVFPVEKDQERG